MTHRPIAGGSRRRGFAATLLLGAGLSLGVVLAPVPGHPSADPAYAASAGTSGYCKDANGVTVVVDFTDLGGNIVVRCAPGPVQSGYDGVDALEGAGFSVTGTQRWGLAFVCRIQGRPSSSESLKTDGNPDYHERCVDTPPTSAYWGYWYARNGGSWTYSSSGPKSHDAIKGGFEGWSFSLNHSAGNQPAPGVAPNRPAATPPSSPPPSSPSTSPPGTSGGPGPSSSGGPSHHSAQPGGQPPGGNGTSTTAPGQPGSSSSGSGPGGDGRDGKHHASGDGQNGDGKHHGKQEKHDGSPPGGSSTDDSTDGSDGPTDSDETARVTGELPTDPEAQDSNAGSKVGTLVGVGVLAALGAGAGVAAWRRSRRA